MQFLCRLIVFLYKQSIVVSWEPPPENVRNGQITGYKIRYKQREDGTADSVTTDGSRRSIELTGKLFTYFISETIHEGAHVLSERNVGFNLEFDLGLRMLGS